MDGVFSKAKKSVPLIQTPTFQTTDLPNAVKTGEMVHFADVTLPFIGESNVCSLSTSFLECLGNITYEYERIVRIRIVS